MGFRRVVTGNSPDGKAIVRSDSRVDTHEVEGASMDIMWRTDGIPTVPNDGSIPETMAFPDPEGVWVFTWTLPANASADKGNDMVEMGEDRPGFHATDTVDVDLVVSGAITLELDDGVKVDLVEGDVVVMNGTIHAWHNPSDKPVTVLSTVVGARRESH